MKATRLTSLTQEVTAPVRSLTNKKCRQQTTSWMTSCLENSNDAFMGPFSMPSLSLSKLITTKSTSTLV